MQFMEGLECRKLCSITLPPAPSIGAVPPQGGSLGEIQIDATVPPESSGKFIELKFTITDLTNSAASQIIYVTRDQLPSYINTAYGTPNTYTFFVNLNHGDHYAIQLQQIAKNSRHGYEFSPFSNVAIIDA
jgi:hypothetical protein